MFHLNSENQAWLVSPIRTQLRGSELICFSAINTGPEMIAGPLWSFGGREPACHCKTCRFSPWVRKIPWGRKWQPMPGFLPGESHGQRSLVGYSPQVHQESDMTKVTQHAHTKLGSATGKVFCCQGLSLSIVLSSVFWLCPQTRWLVIGRPHTCL